MTQKSKISNFINLGYISFPYGLKGWLTFKVLDPELSILPSLNEWYLSDPHIENRYPLPVYYKVLQVSSKGKKLTVKLQGVNDRTQAENLKGYQICIPRDSFPKTNKDEYYFIDLIGCAFYGMDDKKLVQIGFVKDVLDNGAHALLKIVCQKDMYQSKNNQFIFNSKNSSFEMLVPFVNAYISSVNIKSRRIDSIWSVHF
ncbi:MAG: 16S rRNA processing protein RimM [Bordetella sp.]|nr:MAG: 16S rRNA processing protein RimM [Bordetella sp.]